MHEITISYNNADGLFSHDADICQAMNRWGGEETDSGQDLETHTREITYAFEDEGDDSAALEDLADILGDRFREITFTDEPEEPKSTDLAIDFDPGQSRMPQESVSVLTFNRRAGLKHRDDIGATGPDGAEVVFDSFSRRLGWDFEIQADVLLNFCGEDMIEPLLQHIQEAGQTEDFAEFLTDNFGPTARETDFASLRRR